MEKDNLDSSRELQLLHCQGKAKETIESCSNLPPEGYLTAKKTMHENFGKPYVIAGAHIKRLENLWKLRTASGALLLKFARNLDILPIAHWQAWDHNTFLI